MKKVLSFEQINKLKALGIDVTPKELGMIYSAVVCDEYRLMFSIPVCSDDIAAFDSTDIIELLPNEIITDKGNYYLTFSKFDESYSCHYFIETQDGSEMHEQFIKDNMLDAAYEMLVWTIENGYLKVK